MTRAWAVSFCCLLHGKKAAELEIEEVQPLVLEEAEENRSIRHQRIFRQSVILHVYMCFICINSSMYDVCINCIAMIADCEEGEEDYSTDKSASHSIETDPCSAHDELRLVV